MNKILILGNPNVGKTSVFNQLTNSSEKVSNFEGVTIFKKAAQSIDNKYEIIDFPGIYSLSTSNKLNRTVLDALMKEDSKFLIDVIDINNLKKNSYLLIDFLETGKDLVVYLNMSDLFNGKLNLGELKEKFNATFLLNSNKEKLGTVTKPAIKNHFKLDYGLEVEAVLAKLENEFDLKKLEEISVSLRFLAIQTLMGANLQQYYRDWKSIEKIRNDLEKKLKDNNLSHSLNGYFFKKRREFLINIFELVYLKKPEEKNNGFINKYLDKIVLNKYLGFIIFISLMYFIFYLSTSTIFLQDYINAFFQYTGEIFSNILQFLPPIITLVLVNGVWAGLGAIAVFLPQIIIMYALITILEGIGYFPRVSALFEQFFERIGLSSQSLIPMLSGVGCNVIGISTSRIITNNEKRIATLLAVPFISCSARLPIYLIFTEAFFQNKFIEIGIFNISIQALVLTFLYFLGIIVAICYAYIVSKKIYKTKTENKVIVLPKYHLVKMNYLFRMVYIKIKDFIFVAGKLILIGSLVISLLANIGPTGVVDNINDSFIAVLAKPFTFLFIPLGFGSVPAVASLISSFLSKELAVSSMAILYNTQATNLPQVLSQEFTSASALSFMTFALLYTPCLATLGIIYNETKKKKIVVLSVISSLLIAYVLSFIVYHIALLF